MEALIENPYITEYGNLRATSLNREQHERTCGYWYTVTSGATAHTAFRTWSELHRWLTERGLTLDGPLSYYTGEWATATITGSYRKASHRDVTVFDALQPVRTTRVMDNGCMTPAKITEADGIRTIHYMNVNYR